MKQLSAITVLSILSLSANAQFQRGDWMLGTNIGSTGISRGDGFGDGRTISASLTPQVGLFLNDRLVVGAGVGLAYANYRNVFLLPSNISTASISIQPFARYYFTGKTRETTGRVIPFVEAGLGATGFRNWGRADLGNYRSPLGVGLNANVSAGVSYFFTPSIAAEARVLYSYSNGPDISQRSNLAVELGFKVFLHGKKGALRRKEESASRLAW